VINQFLSDYASLGESLGGLLRGISDALGGVTEA